MWLRKKSAGSAPGYVWAADGDVVEVDDALACELLERPGDEFTEVPAADAPVPEKAKSASKANAKADEDTPSTVTKSSARTKVSE